MMYWKKNPENKQMKSFVLSLKEQRVGKGVPEN